MSTLTEKSIESKLRTDLKTICQLTYQNGLITGTDGNLSLKVSSNLILITPSDSHRGLLKEDDFVLVDIEGNILSKGKAPSYDLSIHLAAYKARPEITAIIHAHPPTTVSLSVSNININEPVLPNALVLLGKIGTLPYQNTSLENDIEETLKLLEKHDVIILEKHGSITVGEDIFDAYQKLETLEYTANILYKSHLIGHTETLSENEIKELEEKEGIKLFHNTNEKLTIKKLLKSVMESDKPVFQRVLNLTHEVMQKTIENTSYASKLPKEEKEQLSREITTSFFSMILGRFTRK